VLKSAGTDASFAVFVFLNLLKRDAERIAESALAHLQHEAAHADADADVFVSWLGRFAHVDPSDRKGASGITSTIATIASSTVGHQLVGAVAIILVAAIIGGAVAMVVRLLTGRRR
jgi:hypothetical protein